MIKVTICITSNCHYSLINFINPLIMELHCGAEWGFFLNNFFSLKKGKLCTCTTKWKEKSFCTNWALICCRFKFRRLTGFKLKQSLHWQHIVKLEKLMFAQAKSATLIFSRQKYHYLFISDSRHTVLKFNYGQKRQNYIFKIIDLMQRRMTMSRHAGYTTAKKM